MGNECSLGIAESLTQLNVAFGWKELKIYCLQTNTHRMARDSCV